MSILSRGRSMAAGVIAALAGKVPNVVIVDEASQVPKLDTSDLAPVAVKPAQKRESVAKTRGRPRYRYDLYNGGKHRRGVPAAIMAQYVDAAQAKRERKNAKRLRDHRIAVVFNPCIKAPV